MSEEATVEQAHAEIDYKAKYEEALANSRKWEKRSKENADKARQFDEMQLASKSVEDRLASLEAENKRLTEEREHRLIVQRVSQASGVPEAIVANLSATDEDELMEQAQAISTAYKPTGAPNAPEAGIFPREQSKPKTTAQQFAEYVEAALGR